MTKFVGKKGKTGQAVKKTAPEGITFPTPENERRLLRRVHDRVLLRLERSRQRFRRRRPLGKYRIGKDVFNAFQIDRCKKTSHEAAKQYGKYVVERQPQVRRQAVPKRLRCEQIGTTKQSRPKAATLVTTENFVDRSVQRKSRRQILPLPSSPNPFRFLGKITTQRDKDRSIDENRRQTNGSQTKKDEINHDRELRMESCEWRELPIRNSQLDLPCPCG